MSERLWNVCGTFAPFSDLTLLGHISGFSRFPANESLQKNRFALISFGQNPVFSSLHLKSTIHLFRQNLPGKLDFAKRDQCKPVLLRLSLAGNLVKPFISLYGTE
jgi:hypothetical protein